MTEQFDHIIKRHRPRGWRIAFSKRRNKIAAAPDGVETIADADPGKRVIRAPYVVDTFTLHVLLHEFAHVHLKHWTTGRSTQHREEFEAERWAAEIMRIEGVPVTAQITEEGRRYVRACITEDQKKGLSIEPHVARFARATRKPPSP